MIGPVSDRTPSTFPYSRRAPTSPASSGRKLKIVRSGDRTIEFKIYNQVIGEGYKGDHRHRITKTVRVTLPKKGVMDIHKYNKIIQGIYTEALKKGKVTPARLMSIVFEGKKTHYRWQLIPKGKGILYTILRLLSRLGLFHMVHIKKTPGVVELELLQKRHYFRELFGVPQSWREARKAFAVPKKMEPFEELRGKGGNEGFQYDATEPFTRAASYAYQNLEWDFDGHDHERGIVKKSEKNIPHSSAPLINSDYVMVYDENSRLSLVHKDELKEIEGKENPLKASAGRAATIYKCRFIEEHGVAKFKYAQHTAGFDLDKVEQLTPEHIYRMNIFASGVESQDMKFLLLKIQLLRDTFEKEKNDSQPLFVALERSRLNLLSNREKRAIYRFVASKVDHIDAPVLTVADFFSATQKLQVKKNNLYILSLLRLLILSRSNELDNKMTLQKFLEMERMQELLPQGSELISHLVKAFGGGNSEPLASDFVDAFRIFMQARESMLVWPQLEREACSIKEFFLRFAKSHPHLKINIAEIESWYTLETVQPKNNCGIFMDALDLGSSFSVPQPKRHSSPDIIPTDTMMVTKCVSEILSELSDIDEEVEAEDYSKLIVAFKPNYVERETAYTGRKIQKAIDSGYTMADTTLYKPWVDQQEILQACELLQTDLAADPYNDSVRPLTQEEKLRRFDEFAAFILCKKHLFRVHPIEGYRVGTIIPAPSTEGGLKRWYRVDRMVCNNEGLMYYVFEPVGKESGLETFVVTRSTASSGYNYQGEASVRNDLNRLNAPGYEGRRHLEYGLKRVRKEHTIPIWVGYQHAAALELTKKCPDLQRAVMWLKRAKEELLEEEARQNERKSLTSLIKEFDAEFNDISWATVRFNINPFHSDSVSNERSAFVTLVKQYANSFDKQERGLEKEEQRAARIKKEKEDVPKLLKFIEKYGSKDAKGRFIPKLQELVDALKYHILNVRGKKDTFVTRVPKAVLAAFGNMEGKLDAQSVRDVIGTLRTYAVSLGEDVALKSQNGFRIVGHSLGGSTAQVEAYFMTAGTHRMPVPGTTVNVRLYDDPGMNADDNVDFYDYISKHQEVFAELASKVYVYHSHEYGDLVPTGGPAHLGAFSSKVKELLRAKILKAFEADTSGVFCERVFFEQMRKVFVVHNELKQTTHHTLELEAGDVAFKHGTRFETVRKEKTTIVEVAEQALRDVAKGKQNVNIGTIGHYLIHNLLFDLFASESDEYNKYLEHKKNNEFIYNDPEKCLKQALNNDQGIGRFLHYQSLLENGCALTLEERRDYKELYDIGGKVYFMALKWRHKERVLSELKEVDRRKLRALAERFQCLFLVEKAKRSNCLLKLHEIANIKGKFNRIDEKFIDKHCKNLEKLIVAMKNDMGRCDRKVLAALKGQYCKDLEDQSKRTLRRNIGGVSVKHLSEEVLSFISSHNTTERQKARKIWGTGFFDRKITQKIAFGTDMFVKRYFKSGYADEKREEKLQLCGHGAAVKWWNPKNRTLNVNSNIGAYY